MSPYILCYDKYDIRFPIHSILQYKYQINIDGTVAAYRLPYLLAGDSVVFKQDSPFYEHFYRDLLPNVHYIPFKHDLSDLVEKIKWAEANDSLAQKISRNAQKFAQDNLLPLDILCYHVNLFKVLLSRLCQCYNHISNYSFSIEMERKSGERCNGDAEHGTFTHAQRRWRLYMPTPESTIH